jgi:hypothetical protein
VGEIEDLAAGASVIGFKRGPAWEVCSYWLAFASGAGLGLAVSFVCARFVAGLGMPFRKGRLDCWVLGGAVAIDPVSSACCATERVVSCAKELLSANSRH